MSSSAAFSTRGVLVNYSFYSDREPYILNGAFQLANKDTQPLAFSVCKVWCQVAGQVLPQDTFFVYRLPDLDEEDTKEILIPPLKTVRFEVSFPQISAVPYLQQKIQIGIELAVAGATVTIFSNYRISRRTKRGGRSTPNNLR
ncbi:MAG: hypothetical protein ACYC6L_08980 [Anaerolineae bacterium]